MDDTTTKFRHCNIAVNLFACFIMLSIMVVAGEWRRELLMALAFMMLPYFIMLIETIVYRNSSSAQLTILIGSSLLCVSNTWAYTNPSAYSPGPLGVIIVPLLSIPFAIVLGLVATICILVERRKRSLDT